MWIGAPSIPVVLLQASASLIASVVARSHLSVCPLSLESVCHLSVYSGAARTHKSRRGGRWARVGAIGPGDPGVRVAQRWVLVGSVRGPSELRAHRGGAAAAGVSCFAKIV